MTQEIWRHFSQEQLAEYLTLLSQSVEKAAGFLAEVLNLPNHRFDAREAVRLDYAAFTLLFAHEQVRFGPMRTASLFSIAQQLLEHCIDGLDRDTCQASFKHALLQRCSHKPGADSMQFSSDQIAAIGKFFADTFFRHFSLYQYVFSHPQDHTQYTTQLLVEIPGIQGFDTALSQEEWDAYHTAHREQQEAEAKAAAEAEAARAAEEQRLAEEREKAEAEARRKAELERKPATLEEAIQVLVAKRLESEKDLLAQQYNAKEAELLSKIALLEQQLSGSRPGKK